MKKKMETTRDQLAEALYQKGLALAEIESLKVGIVSLLCKWDNCSIPQFCSFTDNFLDSFW